MKRQQYFRKFFAIVIACSLSFGALLSVGSAAANEQSLPFVDVNPHNWFYEQVRDMFEREIMTGIGAETFAPHRNVTRAMAVQVLYNHAGRPDVSGWGGTSFTDVAADAWYHDAVVWAASLGIVRGFGDGTFAPGDYITRAHVIVILNNYTRTFGVDLPILRDLPTFTDDADIRDYAREAIDRFFQSMIINGHPDGSFAPQGNTTRAELATMLSGFVVFSENTTAPPGPPYGFPCDDIPVPEYGFFDDCCCDLVTPDYGYPGCRDF